jgi:hypothetical protein
MTKAVWIYLDKKKKVGDADHLKVFASADAANKWLRSNKRAGVANRYEVQKAPADLPVETKAPKGRQTVSNGALTAIFFRKMRTYSECPYSGTPIAVVPVGRGSQWEVVTAPYVVRRYPKCAKRVAEVEQELKKIYRLQRE